MWRQDASRPQRNSKVWIHRRGGVAIGAWVVALCWAATSSAMPPPAPGNREGLPPHARELLEANPNLFYPNKGFKPVIERQKARRSELVRDLIRQGLSPQSAQTQSLVRVTTTRYCPVLCGIYADKVTPDWPVQDLVDQLFSLDYGATNTLGQPGSMREHYLDMSYGTFDLQGGVFGWFSVPESAAYYYSDDNGLGTDRAEGETGSFIRHTLQASDATIDFRIYDNDGPDNVPDSGDDDGYADLVMFVHPNEGGECGGDDIWSHSFSYSGWAQHGAPFVTNDIGHDGQPIKVDDYVIMPAISCFGGRIEIGVFSHEFGHALGLPDLYDRTAYDPAGAVSTGGVGLFCLMAAGSYGGDYSHPATPTQMCAWSKEELGFLEPQEIVCDTTRALYCLDDAPEAVKLWRGGDYSQNEWFLVENRQRKKWDKYLLGTGFLITHVDNNVLTQNDESCPGGNPCANHYLVMVMEADGQWEMQAAAPPVIGPWFGEAEDFFNAENNDTWDDLTQPSSRDHSAGMTGVSVHNIGPSSEKMFASFSVSQVCDTSPSLAVSSFRVGGGCDLDGFLDAGEDVSLSVQLRNFPTALQATDIQGTLTSLDPNVSVVNGAAAFPDLDRGRFGESILPFKIHASSSVSCGSTAALRIEMTAAGGYSASDTIVVPVGLDSLFVPLAQFMTDVESGSEDGWKHYSYINEDDWSHNTNANHTTGAVPGHSWFSAAPATGKDASLEPPAFIPSVFSSISFWHKYDTEDNWDGCLLELSTDGGQTWVDVGDMTNVGYDDAVMVNPQSSISGRRCWNGLNAGYPLFEQVTLSLAQWAGQTCRIRFRLGTDLAATGVVVPGWNIDDILISSAHILRQQCEATPVCGGQETAAPVFAGLESAKNPMTPGCDAVDLKWTAAEDESGPITYLVYAATETPVPTVTPMASTTALKFRVPALETGQTYYFLVRARDSQGNIDTNTVEKTVALDCEAPVLDVVAFRMEEIGGCDGDGQPDAGESLDLHVTVRNLGGTHARDVEATLETASDRLHVEQGAQFYGDLDAQHFEEKVFRVRVGTATTCLTPGSLSLSLTAAGGYAATRSIDLLLESDVDFVPQQFVDDVEGGGSGGFTHYAESGTDDWSIVTTDASSPTHSWFASDQGTVTNASLQTPLLFVTSSSVLTFRHKYILESGYDGGVLEISTDDGATWTDIGPNYNSSQNPLGPAFGSPFAPGKAFWSGNSGGFVQASVNLGAMTSPLGAPLYAGKMVLVRWRLGCDNENSAAPFVGWWIDDISLTDSGTFTTVCDGTAPCSPVGLPGEPAPPVTLLSPSRPNPMRASTQIGYQIAEGDAGRVSLRIYDVSGRVVQVLVDAIRQPGSYDELWDGKTATGEKLPGGLYFYELETTHTRHVEKLVILR